jgi:hypothetical protein
MIQGIGFATPVLPYQASLGFLNLVVAFLAIR